MTVLHQAPDEPPALFGRDGELISIRVSVEPRLLEELLEALAILDFPVNPQLYHHNTLAAVEFPAYSTQLEKIRSLLTRRGFDSGAITHERVLVRTQAT